MPRAGLFLEYGRARVGEGEYLVESQNHTARLRETSPKQNWWGFISTLTAKYVAKKQNGTGDANLGQVACHVEAQPNMAM